MAGRVTALDVFVICIKPPRNGSVQVGSRCMETHMDNREREQKLIDAAFELVMVATIPSGRKFQYMTQEDKAAWVAGQLRRLGFDTEPMGCSWGILK